MSKLSDVVVLIPAFQPDKGLVAVVGGILSLDKSLQVLVVDDGSGADYKGIFSEVARLDSGRCEILSHAINLGKGRALKSGMNHLLAKNGTSLVGVVTADADGQHDTRDILSVVGQLKSNPRALVLGCRSFSHEIPLRSKLGNIATKVFFRVLVGRAISDTQTGLRGIPRQFMERCLKIEGERYEYEINMLLVAVRERMEIFEVDIATIYIEDNKSSHFNPLLDSLKIYFVLFRFLLSSLTTSGIDYLAFSIAILNGLSVGYATVIARILAGNYNYLVNRRFVFKSSGSVLYSLSMYWGVVVILGLVSYFGVNWLSGSYGVNVFLAKAIIESALFLVSFLVQRDIVFGRSDEVKA